VKKHIDLDLLHIYSNQICAAISSALGFTVANQLCILNPLELQFFLY